MESVDLWIWEHRKTLDVSMVAIHVGVLGSKVDARWRELVVIILINLFAVELLEDDFVKSKVHFLSNSTTVVTRSSEIVEGVERSLVGVVIDEDLKLLSTDTQVRFIELILLVPSERSVKFTLGDERMVEAKTEQHLSEDLWDGRLLEPLWIRNWISSVSTEQVLFETHGWFICHLNTILKDCNWEVFGGIRSQPESEISVWLFTR
jgi:hypothetical protein